MIHIVFPVVLIILRLPLPAIAQNITASRLAGDFSADGTVVELDIPPALDGVSCIIVWEKQDQPGLHSKVVYAREGRHTYELRNHHQWDGRIKIVAVTITNVPGRIKKPTFSDEIDMFLQPERIAPGTINFLVGHSLFGWSLNTVLLVILLLSATLLVTFKKAPPRQALIIGFVLSWALMDLRSVYDHLFIVYKTESQERGMFPLKDVKVFADSASETIGRGTWGHAPLDWPMSTFLIYRLAEQEFVAPGSATVPAFWITKDPKEGQILLESQSGSVAAPTYYLVKKNQP